MENSGDVTPSEAPHPVPVSTATFHEDIFSSVMFADTDKAGAEHYRFFFFFSPVSEYAMSAIQLASLPDEVTPQSEI